MDRDGELLDWLFTPDERGHFPPVPSVSSELISRSRQERWGATEWRRELLIIKDRPAAGDPQKGKENGEDDN